MILSGTIRKLTAVLGLAAVYFIAGKLGLLVAFLNPNASAVWPPPGISIAALLLIGYRVWPGILIGAFLVNITTAATFAASSLIAFGNLTEALLAAYLINKYAGGRNAFNRAQDIFKFALFAGIACTVSATIGTAALALAGFGRAAIGSIWLTWWLGDMVGAIIITPLLVLWGTNYRIQWSRPQIFEAVALTMGIILVGQAVFGETVHSIDNHFPLDFICIPFLIWTAFRFTQREAATAVFLLSTIAIIGTTKGLGPFTREAQNESLLLLQAFMGVITTTILSLAAVVTERRILENAERRRMEQKVWASEDRLRMIIETEPECVKILSSSGCVLQINAAGLALCEADSPEQIVGKPFYRLVAPAHMDQVRTLHERVFNGNRDMLAYEIIGLKGTHRWVETHAVPFSGDGNEMAGTLSVTRDITERKKAEEARHRIEARLAGILDIAQEAIISINESQNIILFNKKAEEIFGYSQNEVLGKHLNLLLPKRFQGLHENHVAGFAGSHAKAREMGERGKIYGCRKGGEEFPAEASISKLVIENEKVFTVVLRDITYQLRWENTLYKQTISDTLTGLYNRRYFESRIEEEISRAARNQHTLAILLCDLDQFKTINDRRGHQAGDDVLKAVAHAIRDATRGSDLVFRWGGDEFVVILSKTNRDGILIASQRIREGIRKINEGGRTDLDVSIGVALYPEHGKNLDALIRLADRALYIAKKAGNKIHLGEEEYRLDNDTVKSVFQPVVEIGSNQIIGYESLARDSQGKLSVPELFKKYGAIGQLRELKMLCFRSQIKTAQQVKLKRLFINVDFDMISRIEPFSKPPDMDIILEISELEALHDVQNHLKIAAKWREKGYRFAIDDFGAGFISLPFIASLVPEYIKIDRSTMLHAVSSEKFNKFLLPLLESLRTYSTEGIIAEGVETEKELNVLKSMGIRLAQGYLLGKPQELT